MWHKSPTPWFKEKSIDLNLDNLIRLACTLLIPLMGYVWKHTKGCFKSRRKYVWCPIMDDPAYKLLQKYIFWFISWYRVRNIKPLSFTSKTFTSMHIKYIHEMCTHCFARILCQLHIMTRNISNWSQ